jgi:hypothetical protein
MVTTGRNKRRLITHPLHQLEAEHVAVEPEGAFKISDLQVHMTYSNVGIDRIEWHISQLTTSGMHWQRHLGETGVASEHLRYRACDRESFRLRRGYARTSEAYIVEELKRYIGYSGATSLRHAIGSTTRQASNEFHL